MMGSQFQRQRARTLARLAGLTLLVWVVIGLGSVMRPNGMLAQYVPRAPLFGHLKPSQVTRIVVSTDTNSFVLERKYGAWQWLAHPQWPIDSEKVQNMLVGLAEVRPSPSALRSSSAQDYDKLGVGNPKEFGRGAQIQLLGARGQVLALGYLGQIGASAYVRAEDDNRVYRVRNMAPDLRTPESFVALPDWDIGAEDIARASIRGPRGETIFTRAPDGGLSLISGDGAMLNVVTAIGALSPLHIVTDVVGVPPSHQIAWTLNDGAVIGLDVFDPLRGIARLHVTLPTDARFAALGHYRQLDGVVVHVDANVLAGLVQP